jgi:beta-lactamase regulating signal transducer with metallopeptidase domain
MIRLADWLIRLIYAALFGSLGTLLLLLVRRFVTVRAGPRYTAALWTMLLFWMGVILLLLTTGRWNRFQYLLLRQDVVFSNIPLLALDLLDERRIDRPDAGVWARFWMPGLGPQARMTGEAAAVILVCFALWLLGLLLFWLTVLCRYGQMKRALRRLRPAEDPEVGRLLAWERLWLGIREPVEVYFLSGSAGVFSPCAVGLRSSALILPAELWARLSERERDAVVAHELMHIRKRDNLRNLLLLVFHGVFWFAPPIRIALRVFRQDLEYLRDAQVLGETATRRERKGYMKAILAVAEECAKGYRPALHSGMLTGSGVGFRLRLLEEETKRPARVFLSRALWVLTAMAFPAMIVILHRVLDLQAV